jgi:hypothetical protein
MDVPSSSEVSVLQPAQIKLPDIQGYSPFKVSFNQHMDKAGHESEEWFIEGGNLDSKHAVRLKGIRAGLLTAVCYPNADFEEFRVCCDIMNWLVRLRDWTSSRACSTLIFLNSFMSTISRMIWINPGHAALAIS